MTEPLTRFQRVLLDTDGTVTKILEAFADEPMEVVKLLQVFGTAGDADAELLPAPGAPVLRRRVVLRGQRSRQGFLYAEAVVAVDRVAPSIVDDLLRTDRPIGTLLAEARTETFREILRTSREPAGAHGSHFGIAGNDDLVSRTYRIIAGGSPAILITEKFPAGFFRGLPP